MRPTGHLHIGHLIGVLENWSRLQGEYDCFFMVADIHALTTEYEKPTQLAVNSIDIDAEKSVIFKQSDIPQHAELHLYLSMITPLGWLSRCPTYKEQIKELKEKDLHTYGFLGYPLLQAADIMIYRATAVPVGEDQLPHIELTREVARRFNSLYCKESPLFPEPKSLVTKVPKVPGTDGRKMSKSYNNAVLISDERKTLEQKIKTMFTSPKKIKVDDPGEPEGCVVFAFHSILGFDSAQRAAACRAGKLGCVACKKELLDVMDRKLSPIREKRKKITDSEVKKILTDGALRASSAAQTTLEAVKSAMKIS